MSSKGCPDEALTPKQLAKRKRNQEYYKRYMAKNRDKVNARHREQYHKDKERFLTYCRKYHETHPNYIKEYYSTHHKVSVTNKNRTPKMWTA